MDRTILLVDDEELILKTLTKIFTNEDFNVLTAKSGEDALQLLAAEDVRVFVLDLNMPGMNGMELCEEIKKQNPLSCVYALTGYADEYAIEKCREAGFDDYFIKPFKVDQILTAMEEAFAKLLRWECQEKASE